MIGNRGIGKNSNGNSPKDENFEEFEFLSGSLGQTWPNLEEGIRLYNEKQWNKALEDFLSLDASGLSSEELSELAYYLGLCYTKLEMYDDALMYLEQVVATAEDVLRVYQCRLVLAYIYIVTKRARLAEFELKRLQGNGFESPQLYNALAYAAWSQKRYKNAIELYEKALEIDNNNTTAMNSIGFILADTGIDILRGLRLCKRAVDNKPQNAAYLDSLGWAHFKSGNMVEARTWLRRALELAPGEEEIIRHLKIVTGETV